MVLEEALKGFSAMRYYHLCGYTYRCLSHNNHANLKYSELPPRMQYGILETINGLYRVQKMVYSYDLSYVTHCIKSCGVQLKPFYNSCEVSSSFYMTRSLKVDRVERLMRIRLELLRIINRLFMYVLN